MGEEEQQGRDIARLVIAADTGWYDLQVSMTMTLENAANEIAKRELSLKSLEIDNDGDKSLLTINRPHDVKGTRLLNYSHALKADEQWIFIPSIKRTKRVSSKNKSGPFMGSEFAYEDLTSFEYEKYTYKYLRDEKLGDTDCSVIEMIPQYSHSGYSRLEAWVDKKRSIFLQTSFYDRKSSLLKTLRNKNHQKYLDKYWRPLEMEMINHQNNKKTTLTLREYSLKSGLNSSEFNRNALAR